MTISTELRTASDITAAPAVTLDQLQSRAVERLGEWAQAADAAYHVARRLVQSSFVPQAFAGKPVEATAAILSGLEVGLQPMASLRAFDVIQGQAAPRAITLRAIVQSHGHQVELMESTASRCRMRGRRRGSQEWQAVTWTIERARQLGLTNKANWRGQPIAMLMARATSELCRLIAADAILGIPYSAEEIADGAGADVTVIPAVEPEARTMRRESAPEPEPEGEKPVRTMRRRGAAQPKPDPKQDEVPEAEPEQDRDAKPATQRQVTALNAAMTSLGVKDRESKLAFLSDQLGREIGSSRELTRDEASRLIDLLQEAETTTEEDAPAPAVMSDDEVDAQFWGTTEEEK